MAIDLKEKIKEAIDNRSDDDNFLNEIYSVIESYEKDIAGYDFKGNPISYVSLQDQLEEASQRMDKGNYLTSEEVKKRVANWK